MKTSVIEDCAETPAVTKLPTDFSGDVAPYALDAANAERLWEVSPQLIG
ncbi:hypothetical protein [Caballeronia sordidicola]|uniref:Uncharacterized protein n=1 Tax=Caballeronia sordidicola TaxID=196367 RepID=A0A226WPV2_CABSO|nr:hypothetical protein [Caballeronia sordidicola]OXC73221.1 hypothetical protein BSU04_38410 [Caballeronia sordidicola]